MTRRSNNRLMARRARSRIGILRDASRRRSAPRHHPLGATRCPVNSTAPFGNVTSRRTDRSQRHHGYGMAGHRRAHTRGRGGATGRARAVHETPQVSTAGRAKLTDAQMADQAESYSQVHSAKNPGGEVRAQSGQ